MHPVSPSLPAAAQSCSKHMPAHLRCSHPPSLFCRATFTLAAKLAPCVIFIDEVDALLGKRNSNKEHEALRCGAVPRLLGGWWVLG